MVELTQAEKLDYVKDYYKKNGMKGNIDSLETIFKFLYNTDSIKSTPYHLLLTRGVK